MIINNHNNERNERSKINADKMEIKMKRGTWEWGLNE